MEPRETRLYGRRAFLGVTAVGLSSLVWGRSAWQAVSGLTHPFVDALPSGIIPSGWRIYTVAASMPRFDPETWRLRIDGLVDRPQTIDYEQAACAAGGGADLDVPLRDGLDGQQGPLAWCAVRRPSRSGRATSGRRRADVHLGQQPYVDTLTLDQAAPARRDARV